MSQDDTTLKLREAIEAFGAERAPELVAEARAEALAKARTMLAEAMTESLLTHSAGTLRPNGPRAGRTKPARHKAPKRATRSSVQAAPSGEAELGYYVYGVVFGRPEMPPDLAGVDPSHRVDLLEEQGLAAIVSCVSLDEFGEERLRDNLNDVEWLEDKARAHEDVLDAALERATVVPMRLCTIYSGENEVREMLDRERELLLDALHRLEGKAEWGAKLIAEPGALERAAAERARSASDDDTGSQGAAYMNRKRREARIRDEADQVADEWARAVHEQLEQQASEALLNPLQRPEVSGYDGDMILNGVYLVDDHDIAEFRALVDRVADEHRAAGLKLELTGPWPPYNFVKSSIEAAR